ncbi:VirB4 family type IV secretion system protein, partial [Faecalibacterium sp.]|uniref:VirB4 family type IV secretion system protein n=1 Tax=Faecalibacterium sp. TaxID=1971605 RepID=UPI00345D564E
MTKDSSAKRKAGKRKPEKLSFTQDFIPIKNLEHGIIETTDGQYIKILEIEPINFMLRSEEEQYEIICSFASWLKISPVHLQFKSITRKADSDKHIAMLRKEMATEESEQCKKLSEGYIRLIKDVGSREALTRRFFLIFRYEELRRNENSDYGQICSTLLTAEQNARAYFMQCGNNILQPKDPDEATAEILYMFFNRRSCVEEPFHSRVDRIVLDTMAAKNKVIGIDPIPHIRMAHFIAPRGIDLMHRNYIIMDGLYYSFLYIKGNGYPNKVRAGWMSSLINAGEGIDVDVFLRRENRSKTIDKVAQRIRLNRTKLKSMQDTSTDYEELAGSIQAGYFIKQGIANYNEDLFYMSVFVTVSARTYEELMWRKQQMTDMLKSMDMYVSDCSFQQEDALRTVMPFLQISPKLEKKSKRNVLTSGAASTYMFTSFEMSDDTGVLLGINRHNNSLCIVDLFDTKKNKNANLNLLGTSGAGKTFTMQLLALRMRMRGIQCYIIAPIKGHEFRRACNRIGGQFIKIAPGSPHCINIMEIRHTISPEMELIDELDYSEMDSLLAQKIQQLMIFFSLLIPDMTNEEEQMLDEALIRTYGKFGITHDNDSVYEDRNAVPPKMKTMPILGDLHEELQKNEMTKRIAVIVSRFVTGSAQSFNQQTNVDLSNKYIVLDLSELKGKLLPVGMMIALDYVWDKIKSDRTKKKAIMIDEIWQLIGAGSNRMAAEFCLEIFKVIRGFGGAAISATQDLSDFFGLEDGRYGRAIINNSKNKIILNLEPDEAEFVRDTLKLTKTEIRSITRFERGEALICSNNSKVPVIIKASKEEQEMITTDRAE